MTWTCCNRTAGNHNRDGTAANLFFAEGPICIFYKTCNERANPKRSKSELLALASVMSLLGVIRSIQRVVPILMHEIELQASLQVFHGPWPRLDCESSSDLSKIGIRSDRYPTPMYPNYQGYS